MSMDATREQFDRALWDSLTRAMYGVTVRESPLLTDDRAILDEDINTIYVRERREGEMLLDVLRSAKGGIKLPRREPLFDPMGPYLHAMHERLHSRPTAPEPTP